METARLRNALRKLRRLPLDSSNQANVAMAPQESLDFLATLDGLKPVYLLGRGFDDPAWVRGVRKIASDLGLREVSGPEWNPGYEGAVPPWFADVREANDIQREVFYFCKSRVTEDKLKTCCASRTVTLENEAALLGYPLCCVRDHHRRYQLFDLMYFKMVERTAGGNIDEMVRIIREDLPVSPDTPEEIAGLEDARLLSPAPFTSFQMCGGCVRNPKSPARVVSAKYEELARRIDSGLVADISRYQIA